MAFSSSISTFSVVDGRDVNGFGGKRVVELLLRSSDLSLSLLLHVLERSCWCLNSTLLSPFHLLSKVVCHNQISVIEITDLADFPLGKFSLSLGHPRHKPQPHVGRSYPRSHSAVSARYLTNHIRPKITVLTSPSKIRLGSHSSFESLTRSGNAREMLNGWTWPCSLIYCKVRCSSNLLLILAAVGSEMAENIRKLVFAALVRSQDYL